MLCPLILAEPIKPANSPIIITPKWKTVPDKIMEGAFTQYATSNVQAPAISAHCTYLYRLC